MQPPDNFQPNHPHQFQPPPAYPYQLAAAQKPKADWRGRLLVLASWGFCFLLACSLPAIEFSGENRTSQAWYGIGLLALGWLAVFFWQFAWFANLFMLLGIVLLLFRRWIGVLVSGILALLFAANTFLLYSQQIPANEAATSYVHLEKLKVGFVFWVLSILTIIIGAVILRSRQGATTATQNDTQSPQPPYQSL